MIAKDKILIDKCHKFFHSKMREDPSKKFGPFAGCDGREGKGVGDKYVTCLFGIQFCILWEDQWHGDSDCQKKIDKELEELIRNGVITKCLQCRFGIEKNEGCNHMTCRACGFNGVGYEILYSKSLW